VIDGYEVLPVILRYTYLGQDMGTVTADAEQMEAGLYRLGGNFYSLVGHWQIEVANRRPQLCIEIQLAELGG
jgi:hypothetical protein